MIPRSHIRKWVKLANLRPAKASPGGKPRALVLAILLLAGCAFGHVQPGGELVGLAVGHARLESCQQGFEDEERRQSVATGQRCSRIEGGALSTGAAEFFTTVGAAIGAYFGLI